MKLNDFNKGLKEEFSQYDEIKQKESIKKPKLKIGIISGLLCSFTFLFVICLIIVRNNNSNNSFTSIYNEYNMTSYKDLELTSKDELEKRKEYYELHNNLKGNIAYGIEVIAPSGAIMTPDETTTSTDTSSTSTYTSYKSNNQVLGIDEPDIAKFDENYVYYIHYNYLYIYDLNGTLKCKQELYQPKPRYYNLDYGYSISVSYTFYYNDYKMVTYNNLVVLFSRYSLEIYEFNGEELKEKYKINNAISDIRLFNNTLYVVAKNYFDDFDEIDYDCTYYDGISEFTTKYEIICLNLDTFEKKSVGLISSYSAIVYMNKTNIVISNDSYFDCDSDYDFTLNEVFTLDLEPVGTFIVKGEVNKKEYIDVYDGYLRIVSSISWYTMDTLNNQLTIFDLKNKKVASCISKGIGLKNEQVKSVKFTVEGDKCYIVTYEVTDPLYEIDLTDPLNPKIVDALKVEGYSSYLQSFTVDGVKYVFGSGYINGSRKYSIYKDNEDKNELIEDLVLENYGYDFDNPLSLFFYKSDSELLYIGRSFFDEYLLYEIDVKKEEGSIFNLKHSIEATEPSRLFVLNGIMYIPQSDKLIIENF